MIFTMSLRVIPLGIWWPERVNRHGRNLPQFQQTLIKFAKRNWKSGQGASVLLPILFEDVLVFPTMKRSKRDARFVSRSRRITK